MAISANSIIHYTKTNEALMGILKEGFKVTYCSEELILTPKGGGSNAAHPIVSFCDLPLSIAKEHFDSYGHYGIGLTKEWARKAKIAPVQYYEKGSILSEVFNILLTERRDEETNLTKEQRSNIIYLKAYSKNVSGELKRENGEIIENYKFYDEREWRFVPLSQDIKTPFSIALSTYRANKAKYNEKASATFRLKFDVKDIAYIIVRDFLEVPNMLTFLDATFRKKCSKEDLDILFSKICTSEQIISDY